MKSTKRWAVGFGRMKSGHGTELWQREDKQCGDVSNKQKLKGRGIRGGARLELELELELEV